MRAPRTLRATILALLVASPASAQRLLHWDALDVTAHLDAEGTLHVTEAQSMVFTGDWNGGERKFNMRPRQRLVFQGMSRGEGAEKIELTENSMLWTVDQFAWIDKTTLRWRSRETTDPPFMRTRIRYDLRYELSGILLDAPDGYLLDHDFAFRDRNGNIERFSLNLTFDPSWQVPSDVRPRYTVDRIVPGRSFVLKIPLRHTGATAPQTLDLSRPPAVQMAVAALIGVPFVALAWFFTREQLYGRFAPVNPGRVDDAWLREHILKYPAEVVGAAWDGTVGSAEVVALIGRMVSEGKLEHDEKSISAMAMTLKVDRATLEPHERQLVDGLFFDGRTDTSVDLVKRHYKEKGFNPAQTISQALEARVEQVLPSGRNPYRFRLINLALFIAAVATLFLEWTRGTMESALSIATIVCTVLLLISAAIAGGLFRSHIHWGHKAAIASVIPLLIVLAAFTAFVWYWVGTGAVEWPDPVVLGLTGLLLFIANFWINSMKSRQHRAAIAFRKTLATGREFFSSELNQPVPALRDSWYPWIVALGLTDEADRWSTKFGSGPFNTARHTSSDTSTTPSTSPSSSSASSETAQGWTGAGGGRSGGGGGGASWAAAASGLAVGVAPPSSGGSGGSSSSSSSSSSSGGGGGGGW